MLRHGGGIAELTPRAGGVEAAFALDDARDEPEAIRRARALFGLDADPEAVLDGLGGDPLLGPLVRARPGLRVPGAVDGWEIAVRAVLGQQISVAAARVLGGRMTAALGAPLAAPDGTLTRRFPAPEAIAAAPDATFPMPRSRIRTLRGLATARPVLDVPADAAALADLWGIGPWTAGYVAMRLGDPDVFLATDVAALGALTALGGSVADAQRWAPLRSYATIHLWATR